MEDTGDTDDYPQWGSDDEESDCPQHCGNGENCVNSITLSNGSKIGCLIGTNLTTDGVEYVKEAVKEGGLCATEVWQVEFDYIDFPPDYQKELEGRNLTREQLVEVLESVDIQCYDDESYDTLWLAVLDNLKDGTIELDWLP